MKGWEWGIVDVIGSLAEKVSDIFLTKNKRKTSMAKLYETKRIMVARFLVRNVWREVKKSYHGMKSIIN